MDRPRSYRDDTSVRFGDAAASPVVARWWPALNGADQSAVGPLAGVPGGELAVLVREQAALRRVATLVTREASPGEVFGGQQDNFRGTGTFLAWLVRQVPRLSGGQPVVERFSTGGALITLTCVPKPCAGGRGACVASRGRRASPHQPETSLDAGPR